MQGTGGLLAFPYARLSSEAIGPSEPKYAMVMERMEKATTGKIVLKISVAEVSRRAEIEEIKLSSIAKVTAPPPTSPEYFSGQ